MRIIKEKINTKGQREVTVILGKDEKLLGIDEKQHYKLGYPVDEVMAGHILAQTSPVTWCSASQEWVL